MTKASDLPESLRNQLLRQSRDQHRETFIARAVRVFRQNVAGAFVRLNNSRRRSVLYVNERLTAIQRCETEHKVALILWLAAFIWIGLMGWFVVDVMRGRVEGNALQTGVGGVIAGPVLGLIVSPLIALAAFIALLLVNKIFMVLAPVIPFLPLILWTPIYAVGHAATVVGKLLLLIPLVILFLTTRLVQLFRGIFYTCPSRHCVYRGLPLYVCGQCGQGNPKLWPNLYGLLWHHCVVCDMWLPTLNSLGRKSLGRLCGGCGIPLLGKHAGRAPERLVAIIGGPGSGKTSYLLMAVNEITNGSLSGTVTIRGEIDDEKQEQEFQREWKNFAVGLPAAKTSAVAMAFLLYAKVRRSRCQLYLYDAPGEEFTSISSMTSALSKSDPPSLGKSDPR